MINTLITDAGFGRPARPTVKATLNSGDWGFCPQRSKSWMKSIKSLEKKMKKLPFGKEYRLPKRQEMKMSFPHPDRDGYDTITSTISSITKTGAQACVKGTESFSYLITTKSGSIYQVFLAV